MNRSSSALAAVALVGAVFTAPLAQAQSYGAAFAAPTPFYPYAVQADQPYAVEVAPNTYVIKRPALARNYPYVRGANALRHKASVTPFARVRTRNDRAVIEELRQRHTAKRGVIETKKIVHDKPVVIETRRVVDDPPRIIERRHYVEDAPAAEAAIREKSAEAASRQTPTAAEARDTGKSTKLVKRGDEKQRVIRAEAEVTILGPDRMSIRLFRKRAAGGDAKASAE
jgi:hypothetical protein